MEDKETEFNDLYTQAEYARRIGKTRQWVNHLVKKELVETVKVNGAVLIRGFN